VNVYLQVLLGVVAVAVAFWPQIKAMLPAVTAVSVRPAPPSYQEAIAYLAKVRTRLLATDALDESRKQAIDVLTLALVDGSDK
jgi:hypothetical protein